MCLSARRSEYNIFLQAIKLYNKGGRILQPISHIRLQLSLG